MESAKSSISDPDKISLQTEQLSKLVCPVCFEYMKPPIFECEKGHGICELCYELLAECPLCKSTLTHRRSNHLETLTTLVLFPCKQCNQNYSLDELEQHKCVELVDEIFENLCLIGQVYGKCTWKGLSKDMVEHCSTQHPANCWTKKENVTKWHYDDLENIGVQNMFVIDLTEAIFILVQKFDSNTQSLQWNISCESEKESEQYVYEIELFSDSKETLKYRNVIENQDNIMMSLPNSNEIVIPINKVIEFLNDNIVSYRVIIHKKIDMQNDQSVKYYQAFSEVHSENNEQIRNDVQLSCSQKTWYSIVDIYKYIKKRIWCC